MEHATPSREEQQLESKYSIISICTVNRDSTGDSSVGALVRDI